MRSIATPIGLSLFVSLFLVASAKSQDTGIHGLGAKAPSQDQISRFPKFKAPERRAAIPPKMDSSKFMPPIGDQGGAGSCVAWSTGYGLRSFYLAKNNKLDVSKPENQPSPAYIFNHGSAVEQSSGKCSERGMLISTALEILRAGVVSLAEMPYDDQVCGPPPDIAMQSRAKEFRIDGWAFVEPSEINAIKGALADGNVVPFGIKVSQSFLKHQGNGVYSHDQKEASLGSHAMVLVGYDDDKKAFRLQNSWGPKWGDQGRAWISYDTFSRDANDAYIVRADSGR